MKNIFYILLLLPTIIFAQYPNNSGQKITLGEQTTADGLVYRGLAADTTRKPSVDTMAYILLDTNTNIIWQYKKATNNAWTRLNLLPSDTTSFNYVNTYDTQTVNGAKTFTSDVTGARFNPTSSTATGTGMFLPAANTLGFSTNNSQKFLISPEGNLSTDSLSKTNTPYKTFELGKGVGTSVMAGRTDGFNAFLLGLNFYYDGGTNLEYIGTGFSTYYSQNSGNHTFFTAPSGNAGANITYNEIARFTKEGNVGIGTESPGARLHVKGVDVTANNFALKVDDSNSLNLLSVKNNGNVGIGIITPNSRLHTIGSLTVNDNIYLQRATSSLFLSVANYWDGIGNPMAGTKGDILAIGNAGGDGLALVNSNTVRMFINSSGNVGIGTDGSAGYKLDVNGTGRFSGGGLNEPTLKIQAPIYPFIDLIIDNANTNARNWRLAGVYSAYGTFEILSSTTQGDVPTTSRFSINGVTGAVTINNLESGLVYSNAGTLTNTDPSDSTLKNSINSYTYGLSEILQLKPKTFYYNSDVTRSYLKYGFIAQDVQPIMPDLVRIISNGNDKLGLESNGIYVAMVNAIKELSAEIDILKQEIINLKNK